MNIYEKIINNHLETLYLKLLSYTKDNEEAISLIYRAFEKLFVCDFHYLNLLSIKDRFLKNLNTFLKYDKIYFNVDNCVDYQIDERLYLFNFNFAKYFNEIDNKILISIVFDKIDIKKLSNALGYDEMFILNRYLTMINWIKTQFLSSTIVKLKLVRAQV